MTEIEVIELLKQHIDEYDAPVDARELIRFSAGDEEKLKECIERRISGEPLQYIIGEWDFYNCNFRVGEGVLIPRPETELLVDTALDFLAENFSQDGDDATSMIYKVVYGTRVRGEYVLPNEGYGVARVLDLCSGSGCIAISIAKNFANSKVFAIEKSSQAFEYLKQNVALNRVKNVVPFNDDIVTGCQNLIGASKGQFDLIVSNQPYVKSAECDELQREVLKEPRMALDGGEDGLDFYRVIANRWLPLLKSGGMLIMECGEDQAVAIEGILSATSCGQTFILDDFAGISRVVGIKMY